MGQLMSQAAAGAAQSAATAQQQQQPGDQFPWYFRYGAKVVGIVGGILSLAFGLWALIAGTVTFSPRCIFAGSLEMVMGFFVVALEGPFLCMCVEFIGKIQAFSDTRPPFHKFLLYCVSGVIPIILCIDLSTFLGGGTVFCCGIMYGVMAFGKKADHATMTAAAGGGVPEAGASAGPPPYGGGAYAAPPAYGNPWDSNVDNTSKGFPPAQNNQQFNQFNP